MDDKDKIDELIAHVFYIEGLLNCFLGVNLDQAGKSLENLRKTVKNLSNYIPKEELDNENKKNNR